MEYKIIADTICLRLDPQEEILQSLQKLCEKESISLAEISGIGALQEATLGLYDTKAKVYHPNRFQGGFEMVGLSGSISQQDGKPYLHLHMVISDQAGHCFGGHVNEAIVSATAELFIRKIPGKLERTFDEITGLNLFDFQKS